MPETVTLTFSDEAVDIIRKLRKVFKVRNDADLLRRTLALATIAARYIDRK